MRVLFVCSQNRLRSPTAEQVFSKWPGIECASAGVQSSADVPLDIELIAWANIIFVVQPCTKRNGIEVQKTLEWQTCHLLGHPRRL
jgi:predicted protein tyrosine phosphatase